MEKQHKQENSPQEQKNQQKKNSTVHSGPAEMSPSQCSRLEAVLGSAGAPPQCQIPVRLSELVEGADGVGQEGDQAAVQASPVLPLRALVLKHTQRMGSWVDVRIHKHLGHY